MTIYKNTPLEVKQKNRNLTGYWVGHLYHLVEGVHFNPGTFTFHGSLDDLLDLIDEGEDLGLFSVDVPSEDIADGLMDNGIETDDWDGEDSWDVEFKGEDKPEHFEEFELNKLLEDFR